MEQKNYCYKYPHPAVTTEREGALRELKEETGLENAYIEHFNTYSDPGRDPRERVITIAHYALVRIQEVQGGDDALRAVEPA